VSANSTVGASLCMHPVSDVHSDTAAMGKKN